MSKGQTYAVGSIERLKMAELCEKFAQLVLT